MRITVDTPGARDLWVMLDDKPVGFVVEADDEEGWVDLFLPGTITKKRVTGKVEFLKLDDPRRSTRYHHEWRPNELNVEFWGEVLVGRRITCLEWDDKGISALVLDSGERVYLPIPGGRLAIKSHDPATTTFAPLDLRVKEQLVGT